MFLHTSALRASTLHARDESSPSTERVKCGDKTCSCTANMFVLNLRRDMTDNFWEFSTEFCTVVRVYCGRPLTGIILIR